MAEIRNRINTVSWKTAVRQKPTRQTARGFNRREGRPITPVSPKLQESSGPLPEMDGGTECAPCTDAHSVVCEISIDLRQSAPLTKSKSRPLTKSGGRSKQPTPSGVHRHSDKQPVLTKATQSLPKSFLLTLLF
jgi:hypothetical protein